MKHFSLHISMEYIYGCHFLKYLIRTFFSHYHFVKCPVYPFVFKHVRIFTQNDQHWSRRVTEYGGQSHWYRTYPSHWLRRNTGTQYRSDWHHVLGNRTVLPGGEPSHPSAPCVPDDHSHQNPRRTLASESPESAGSTHIDHSRPSYNPRPTSHTGCHRTLKTCFSILLLDLHFVIS